MNLLTKSHWQTVNAYGTARKREITYRAKFYDSGKYVERDCADTLYDKIDGNMQFLNTSSGVSYYSQLMKESCK